MSIPRGLYHPSPIGTDFIRRNAFEMIIQGQDPLRIMCKSCNLVVPQTNVVAVPWVGAVMQVAGRVSTAYTFSVTFLAGWETQYNAWQDLYNWRNKVFNHDTGRIALAHEYKLPVTLRIFDVTTENEKATVEMEGVWPSNITDLQFDVTADEVMEVTAQFCADKIQITSFA